MAKLNFNPIEIIVPKEKKLKIQQDLCDLDINEAFLFPEIDKVSEYLINTL